MDAHIMAAAAPPPQPPPRTTTPVPVPTPSSFSSGQLDEGFQAGRKPRKEYKCHACDKVFKRSEHFTRHVRVHTKERPFSCRFCQKTYGRKDLVRRHEKTLHAELSERADAELARNGGGRQHNARRDSELQQQHHQQQQAQADFNHAGSYAGTEQPYPMHHGHPQEPHLYSPVSHQSGSYDYPPEHLQHSDPPAQGEPLMIDPMLEEAFAGQGMSASDQYDSNTNQRSYPQSTPYYHQSAAGAIPVDPSLGFGDENSEAADRHQAPSDHGATNANPAYGQYSGGYEPQPYDYR